MVYFPEKNNRSMNDQAPSDNDSRTGESLHSMSDVEDALEEQQTQLKILNHRIEKLEARADQESDNSVDQRVDELEEQIADLETKIETIRQALVE